LSGKRENGKAICTGQRDRYTENVILAQFCFTQAQGISFRPNLANSLLLGGGWPTVRPLTKVFEIFGAGILKDIRTDRSVFVIHSARPTVLIRSPSHLLIPKLSLRLLALRVAEAWKKLTACWFG
jgi:hypothetical protein